eukprot:TRINITY_DN22288_c0_g1_i2.p1 TRINITY_DN22288_c0_g1~~TRINITY_DN22288_c0_g1_i2.p1  ORF type:complete len:143 (+),score=1.92 TRINITY_DN22288_c0_g1_i2:53-481(+)
MKLKPTNQQIDFYSAANQFIYTIPIKRQIERRKNKNNEPQQINQPDFQDMPLWQQLQSKSHMQIKIQKKRTSKTPTKNTQLQSTHHCKWAKSNYKIKSKKNYKRKRQTTRKTGFSHKRRKKRSEEHTSELSHEFVSRMPSSA